MDLNLLKQRDAQCWEIPVKNKMRVRHVVAHNTGKLETHGVDGQPRLGAGLTPLICIKG